MKARTYEARRVEIGIIARDIGLRKWYGKLGFSVKETVRFSHLPFKAAFMFLTL
ncbi:MAG: hypothetical protein JRG97_12140 [Deltaproteobacteria bacterium]|nr:hypothetical protein [Deltaproteobacteria bacterium]MBW2052807.1 hypothetical protein [Deltaproteobacteria bacterium]MBW2141799.1 hypothetical protein [Deltaproteobacteria bacterium]MBW2324480.1 hypothetical protein [Deltaproteobacteria bacterium]